MHNQSQHFRSIHTHEDTVHPVCCLCWELREREQSSISSIFLFILSSSLLSFTSFPLVLSFPLPHFCSISSSHFIISSASGFSLAHTFLKFLKCPSSSSFLYHLIYGVLRHWLADNAASRRLHHVWLTGERPGTQNPHAPLIPSDDAALIHPSMYSA